MNRKRQEIIEQGKRATAYGFMRFQQHEAEIRRERLSRRLEEQPRKVEAARV